MTIGHSIQASVSRSEAQIAAELGERPCLDGVSVRSHSALHRARRTNEGQPDQACDANNQAHDIEQEMFVVVDTNTSVHPWTVAMEDISNSDSPVTDLGLTY